MRSQYKYWRIRQLYSTFIGYGIYYFVRKNIPIAIPLMETDLGLAKADLGKILSFADVFYGISKFINGFLGDRCNARYFMAVGLLMSAIANFFFGMSSALWVLIGVWMINGWFQGMGSPPCSRIICHWFSPRERGTYWSIWNTSHQVGLSLVLVMAGYLGEHFGWRFVFYVPAAIAGIVSLFLLERLRDTPASLGLPPAEVYAGDEQLSEVKEPEAKQSNREFFRFLCGNVFNNPYVWAVCIANFFIYILRYGFVNWAPSYLSYKGIALTSTGWMVAGFEIAGLVGSLIAGWMTDRFFNGRRAPVCVAYMLLSAAAIFCFWKMPFNSPGAYAGMLLMVGFMIYGPQLLVAVMACDLATKRAAATAVGMTGLFGYLSAIVSGWGLGHILDSYGWDWAFRILVLCALLATLPFVYAWNAKPKEYDNEASLKDGTTQSADK